MTYFSIMKNLLLAILCLSWATIYGQNKPQLLKPAGHALPPFDFSIAPNSKRIVSVSLDNSFIVWDIPSKFPIYQHVAHSSTIYSVDYSHDGSQFMTASLDGTIKFWDAKSYKLIGRIDADMSVTDADFTSNDSLVIASGTNGMIKVYNTETKKMVSKNQAHSGQVNFVTLSTNDKLYYTGDNEGHVKLWALSNHENGMDLPLGTPVTDVIMDPYNTAFSIQCGNGRSELISLPDFKPFGAIPTPTTKIGDFSNQTFVADIAFSPDIKFTAYTDTASNIFIADLSTQEARGYKSPHPYFIYKLKFSPDGRYLVSSGFNSKICIADLKDLMFDDDRYQQIPYSLLIQNTSSDYTGGLKFTKDNRLIARGEYAYSWNMKNGDQFVLPQFQNGLDYHKDKFVMIPEDNFDIYFHKETETMCIDTYKDRSKGPWSYTFNSFSRDESFAIFRNHDRIVKVDFTDNTANVIPLKQIEKRYGLLCAYPNKDFFGLCAGSMLYAVEYGDKLRWKLNMKDSIVSIKSNAGGTQVLIACANESVHIIDLDKGKIMKSYKDHVSKVSDFVPGENAFISFDFENKKLVKFNYSKGKSTNIRDLNTYPLDLCISHDSKLMAVEFIGGRVEVFDIQPKKTIYDIYFQGDNGITVASSDGYYMSSPSSYKDLAFIFNDNIYPCEQFDAYLNRPDLVLAQSPYADAEMINLFADAVDRRKRKLNLSDLNALMKDRPEVEITNKYAHSKIVFKPDIDIELMAKGKDISTYNVWINDVPIHGIDGKKLNSNDFREHITLVPGKNKIQFAAQNSDGNESLRDAFEITYDAKNQDKPQLYIVSLGVSEYENSTYNLKYAAKDAEDVIKKLGGSKAFSKVNSMSFKDKDVDKSVLDKVHSFFQKAGPQDIVLLFVAGHGVLDANLDYYYAAYDTDFDDPAKNGIAYNELEAVLDKLKTVRKMLLMDTCHSGEVDDEEYEVIAQNTTSNEGASDLVFRTAGANVQSKFKAGAQNAFNLARESFTDLRKFTGTTVLSSAAGGEFAIESKEWQNGLFTYCLLNGLSSMDADLDHDGEIWLSEIQDYLYVIVPKLSNGAQKPTTRMQNLSMDYRLW